MTTVRTPRRLPVILSPREVARLPDAAPGLKYRAALSLATLPSPAYAPAPGDRQKRSSGFAQAGGVARLKGASSLKIGQRDPPAIRQSRLKSIPPLSSPVRSSRSSSSRTTQRPPRRRQIPIGRASRTTDTHVRKYSDMLATLKRRAGASAPLVRCLRLNRTNPCIPLGASLDFARGPAVAGLRISPRIK